MPVPHLHAPYDARRFAAAMSTLIDAADAPAFSRRLRALRDAADLTQTELGALAGLDKNTISLIELGRVRPHRLHAQALLAALEAILAQNETPPVDGGRRAQ